MRESPVAPLAGLLLLVAARAAVRLSLPLPLRSVFVVTARE